MPSKQDEKATEQRGGLPDSDAKSNLSTRAYDRCGPSVPIIIGRRGSW